MTIKAANKVVLTVLAFATLLFSAVVAEDEKKSDLSHAALFAPNKEFPYFESVNELAATESGFDAANAATLAQFSLLVYVREEDFLTKILNEAGYPHVETFGREGTFAILAANDENVVLAFRGTEGGSIEDYLADTNLALKKFEDIGRAHAGFIKALGMVDAEIQESISTLLEDAPNRKLWITGHSLGAALATLYAVRHPEHVEAIYTIGSPRIAGRKLADSLSESLPLYRIVNDNDLVARLPTPPLYRHIGSTYFITTEGELVVDPGAMDKWKDHLRGHKKLITRIWTENWSEGKFGAIPSDYFVDHSPRLYVEALLALSQGSEHQ